RLPWAVLLLFALILGVNSSPLLNERASQKCNAKDVQIVKRTAMDPVYFCTWWNSEYAVSAQDLLSLNSARRVTAACKCIASTKTKRTEHTEEHQDLEKRQTTESCRREVGTQFTQPWHFCNFYNAYPRKSSPFKKYTASQLLKLCNCVEGKSVSSSTKKTTSSVKTTSKKTSATVKSSSTTTKKTSSSSSKAISSTRISSSSKLSTSSSKSTGPSSVKLSSTTTRKTSSSSSSALSRSSTSSSAIPQYITVTQIITVTEGPKSSLSTATSTLVTTIPLISDETSTVSSTTTEVSTTTITVTTTDLTAVTQMYKRKRDIAPITTECGHDHKLKRQAPTPTPTETSASSSEISSSSDSSQSTIVTPAALQTFSASVLSSACSAEITTTATTVTEVSTESTVSTETSTQTISSTTTISIASSAPTGVIGYLEIRPVINAGAQYVRSDDSTHMTDNGRDPSSRETFIITSDNKLYSVTNNAYYYVKGHPETTSCTGATLPVKDKRTAPTGVYYKFCLSSDRGGSTGSHMYFYGANDAITQSCQLVDIYFAPTS
ncbi:unnamed protein product, partial [Aureobasidium mustum]